MPSAPGQGPSTECKEEKPEVGQLSISDVSRDELYCFADGNVHLLVNKRRVFCVHRFKLDDFSNIKTKMNSEQSSGFIALPDSPEDLHNTFEVIYSCPYALERPEFDTEILVSALRIATAYGNAALREFAIHKLESRQIPALDRLPIARECNIPNWERWVLDELANRAEPVTLAEAQVLGMDTFVLLAARRETKPPETSEPTLPDNDPGRSPTVQPSVPQIPNSDTGAKKSEDAPTASCQEKPSSEGSDDRPAKRPKVRPKRGTLTSE